MKNFSDISSKRWFMGKGKGIASVQEIDSAELGDTRILILQVTFADGSKDLYSYIEDESRIGSLFHEAFADGACVSIFPSPKGYFRFKGAQGLPTNVLRNLKPLTTEQSNSAFFVPGKLFFKLFRRLQPGLHPEAEILQHLAQNEFSGSPAFYGSCEYHSESGETFTLGILEQHFQGATDAWVYFNQQMDENSARELGVETARMHKVLKGLDGTNPIKEEPPFEKLEELLKIATTGKSRDAENIAIDGAKNVAEEAAHVLEALPRIKKSLPENESDATLPPIFQPQRIHGDFHLGQVLKTSEGFKILDFEGEPTRDLDFRRRLRSPAVDIAGMLRSFRYAAATSRKDCSAVEAAFLEGYSEESGIDTAHLQKAAAPYVLSKAVYEACYELEFRPDWFWIPAEDLINS